MNTQLIAAENRLTHWAGIMRERQESGLSIRAYCKQSGFHENIYYYWQRKLREATYQALSQETSENGNNTNVIRGRWTVCEVVKEEPKETAAGNDPIRIEIGKCTISVNGGTNQELLAMTCRTLMSLC